MIRAPSTCLAAEVPQKKTPAAKELFLTEVRAFVDRMSPSRREDRRESLAAGDRNWRQEQALRRFHVARAADPVHFSGLDEFLCRRLRSTMTSTVSHSR